VVEASGVGGGWLLLIWREGRKLRRRDIYYIYNYIYIYVYMYISSGVV